MGQAQFDSAYATHHELAFIHMMHAKGKRDVLLAMREMLPYRRWDLGVDPDVVKAAIELALNAEVEEQSA